MKPFSLSLQTSTNVPACLVKMQQIVQMVSISLHANAPRDTQGRIARLVLWNLVLFIQKRNCSRYPTKTTLGALSWCSVILRKVFNISLGIAIAADCPKVLFFWEILCGWFE